MERGSPRDSPEPECPGTGPTVSVCSPVHHTRAYLSGGFRRFNPAAIFLTVAADGPRQQPLAKPANPVAEELRRWRDEDRPSLYPEKQHLVPFAMARQIVDKGGTRATSSPSNAIGNLSWLSHRQNGLGALADRWAVLDERRDRDNLEARGILAQAEFDGRQSTVLEIYTELRDLVLLEGEAWKSKRDRAFRLFDAFCEGRAGWMVERMQRWLEVPLTSKANSWLRE